MHHNRLSRQAQLESVTCECEINLLALPLLFPSGRENSKGVHTSSPIFAFSNPLITTAWSISLIKPVHLALNEPAEKGRL
jgi:hypothetical protein